MIEHWAALLADAGLMGEHTGLEKVGGSRGAPGRAVQPGLGFFPFPWLPLALPALAHAP